MPFTSRPNPKRQSTIVLSKAGLWRALLHIITLMGLSALLFTTVNAARLYMPVVAVTMTDAFVGVHDGDGRADPGETIQYTAVINNTGVVPGTDDATGVTFTDTIDSNTTLVGGSVSASPVGVNDTFPVTVTGNISINSAALASPFSVTANDYLGQNPEATISQVQAATTIATNTITTTTANGGNIVMTVSGANMGFFTYDPPAGFEGTDTFTYVLSDNTNAASAASNRTATVSITVSGMVWFVNNNATACTVAGCGRLSNPFSTLAAFNTLNDNAGGTHPGNNDNIFIYESAIPYTGGITLLSGQKLVGQDSTQTLSAIAGISPVTGSAALPAMNTGAPVAVIQNAGGNGITLGSNNTLNGLTAGNASGSAISGSGFGTLTASNVIINSNGQALSLTNGVLSATFSSVTSTGGTNNIALAKGAGTLTGTLTISGGALSGATGNSFDINGGTATISNAAAITSGSARSVNVTGLNGGTVTFSGAINDTDTGISLTSNTGATINFTGALTVSTGANPAFTATGGGTVSATDTTSTLTTTTGTALNVTSTTIGASGLTFRSISSNGASSGIVLNGTGSSGGLTVTGNVSAGSGGTIQNGATGISLTSTSNVSLNRMQLNDFSDYAIRGSSVINFTMTNTVINGTNGDNAVTFDGSVRFTELTGSASVTNSSISGGFVDNFNVVNTSGTLNRITFDVVTIGANSTSAGSDGILIEGQNSAVVNTTVQNSFFTSTRGDHFQLNLINTASSNLIFTGNNISNSHPAVVSGGGGIRLTGGSAGGNVTATFNISNNIMRDSNGTAIGVTKGAGAGSFSGTISGNQIGVAATANSGSAAGSGISVIKAETGSLTTAITNNQVYQYANFGIIVQAGGLPTPGSGNLDATVTGNTISNPGTLIFAKNGFQLNSGTVASDAFNVCLSFGGPGALANSLTGSGTDGGTDFRLRQRQSTTVRLPGYGSANNNDAAVVTFGQGNNGGSPTGSATNTVPTGGGWVGGAACATAYAFSPSNSILAQAQPETVAPVLAEVSAPQAVEVAPETFANDNVPGRLRFGQTSVRGGKPLFSVVQPAPVQSGEAVSVPPSGPGFTLPAGKSVTITYRVTVDNPLPQNKTRILNQGSVSGSNFATVTTSESPADSHAQCTAAPSIGNQTCTPVDLVDLSVSKGNDVSGTVVLGNSFTWQVQVSNIAASRSATFTNAQVVLEDHLPSGATYAAPSIAYTGGIIGTASCSITSNVLTCTADVGGLTIPPAEAVAVAVTVTPTSGGSLVNPTGGVCAIDPNAVFAEISTANNNCSNTVTVTRPNTTITSLTRTDSNPNNTASVGWQIVFANPVSGLTASNFSVVMGGGVTGATIDSVGTAIQASEPDTSWNITVNTGSGNGTLGLNFVNDTNMSHAVTTTLPYVGEVYTIDKTAPTVTGVTYNSNTGCLGSDPYYCNAGDTVQINVSFSESVNVVSGVPTLTLNSGGVANYLSGNNSNTLVFEYIVAAAENAGDLDYTSTSALSGNIEDIAANPATPTLFSPGASGSLGSNANVVIDTTAPTATNFNRLTPSTTPTSADTLTWQAIFSEDVTGVNVDGSDFTIPALTGDSISVSAVNATTYDVTASGGDLVSFTGLVDLDFIASPSIADLAGNALFSTIVGFDQHYMMDNIAPTVTMSSSASNPTNVSPIPVTVTFSESVTDFSAGDISTSNGAVDNFAGSGTVYTFDLVPAGQGLVTADIAAGVAQDDAGNNNTAAAQFSRIFDSVAPTVTINQKTSAPAQPDPTGTSPINFTVVFSESVGGSFTTGDVNLSASTAPGTLVGTVTEIAPNDGTTYNVAVSGMSGDGTVIASVDAGVATDGLNTNAASTSTDNSVLYDTVAPSVTIVQAIGQSDPTDASPINFTVTFSEDVTDFNDPDDVSLTGTAGATTINITGGPKVYNVAVSGMTNSGTVIASVPASVAVDLSSQPNTASPATGDRQVTYIPPTDLTITKTDGAATEIPGTSVTYTITVSNAGPNSDPAAVVADTLPASLSGASWTCVGAGGGTCAAAGSGNINETVNLPVGGSVTFTVTATVSASATGTLANTATVASSISDTNPANNTATDTDTLTPQADLSITKTDGQTSDTPGTGLTYTIVASNAGPSNAPGATIADTLSAALTGATWTCTDAGGATCDASGSGNINESVNLPAGGSVTFTVTATINPSATGTLSNTATVFVPGGVTDPSAGNNSATDTTTLTPQADLSISKTDGASVVVPGGAVIYTITVSNDGPSNAPGSSVTDTLPAILNGASWTCVGAGGGTCTASGSGNIGDAVNLPAGASVTYTVNATVDLSATGTLSNTAAVAVGGGITDPTPANNSATDTDNIVPPVEVTIEQASGQSDPASAEPVNFTVIFGLPVTGFVGGDVTLGGAAGATTAIVTEIAPNDGTTYNVAVSGMTGDGAVTASIAFGTVTGPQGEPNDASTSADNSVFYDATSPDTTITANPANPTSSTSASFSFTGSDGSGVGGLIFECSLDGDPFAVCSSPESYTGLSDGDHTFQVRAVDGAGNIDASPASFTWSVDTTQPDVVVSSINASPTNDSPITITITFSEVVTGFTPSVASGDIVIGGVGGADSNPQAISGSVYTFDLAPGGQGVVTVTVPDSSAQDAASNWSAASNTFNITYDSVAPTVTINQAAAQPDPTSISPVNFTVAFSEVVTGFGNADIVLGGTAGANTAVVTEIAPNDGTTYNVAVSGMSTSGTITAEILAGVLEDLAGNSNDASTSTDNTVTYNHDVVPPVVVSSLRADLDPTSASSVNFIVTFSEPVTGVDVSDFALTTSGVLSASVSGVSGSGSVYTVTVNSGSGNGSIRLDVLDDDTILDEALNPLDDSFTEGQAYTITGRNSIFADVPYSYWANSYIERLYNAGITSGCGFAPLIYCPEQYVTRAEMAVFLLRSIYGSSYSPPPATGLVFNDVPATHWAAAWIEQLYEDGFTAGCSNDNYCPEQVATTRAQMAIFLLRGKYGAAYAPPAPVGLFNDVPVDYWAAAWIEQLAAEGITTGCGGGNYCPEEPLTRAQMAVFLVRTFGLP